VRLGDLGEARAPSKEGMLKIEGLYGEATMKEDPVVAESIADQEDPNPPFCPRNRIIK